eukprot:CAMPEP_0204066154 /NCGR_PEP_ID=MMETSP0360-20130528/151362_1 /ASSEMBLY_ACC=CAM_ASM_000342 /TAXON_ID=268821 /ORGANISM="Scrippsiella Hangoei, Strain SHTV-5" /LENGTH=68 /DNA_ID=CAMNT_0051014181 /DNA_START=25 /DNA_END=228 /DNA_ORIENTATION=+
MRSQAGAVPTMVSQPKAAFVCFAKQRQLEPRATPLRVDHIFLQHDGAHLLGAAPVHRPHAAAGRQLEP